MQKIKCYNGRASIVGLTLFAFTILAILGAFNSPTNAADRERSWHIDARSLTIRNMIGSVKVEPASGNEFVVTAVIGGKNSDGHLLEFKLDEGKSTLLNVVYPLDKYRKYKYPEHKGKTSFSGWNFDDDVSVLSKVFRASNKKITVSNNSGEVEVWCDFHIQIPEGKVLKVENGVGKMDAVDAVGDITLDTASGNLSFTNCRGELTADTGSGDVSVKQVGGEILIDTGSGDVEGTDIKGPIDIDTGSGDVFLKEMQCAQILVDTGSGSVQLFNFISDKVDVIPAPEMSHSMGFRLGISISIPAPEMSRLSLMKPPAGSSSLTPAPAASIWNSPAMPARNCRPIPVMERFISSCPRLSMSRHQRTNWSSRWVTAIWILSWIPVREISGFSAKAK
ncbi:MAG: DUF4097 domain-containing protein [Candidatus Eisenbacteria bacterium]|nr:DUF4097 domain-containing protein [Candidatus Eisenbacteria bacterium]